MGRIFEEHQSTLGIYNMLCASMMLKQGVDG